MIRVVLLISFIVSLIRGVSCAETNYVSNFMIELNDSSIRDTLEFAPFSLLYFYSDTCKYCKAFDPVFEYVSVLYNTQDREEKSDLQVLKVNAGENQKLSELFGITRYPTLKLLNYKTKEIIEYNRKDRRLEFIISFLEDEVPSVSPNYENYRSPVTYLNNDNFDTFVNGQEEDVLVVFTASYVDGWDFYTFPSHFIQTLATSNSENLKFGLFDLDVVEDLKVLEKYMIRNIPSIVYFERSGRIKIFKTCRSDSGNPGLLNSRHLAKFLENLHSQADGYGIWLNQLSELEPFCSYVDVSDGTNEALSYGFNLRHSASSNDTSLEDEYDILAKDISL